MSALTIAARFAVLALLSGLAACSILPKAEPLQVYLLPSQASAPATSATSGSGSASWPRATDAALRTCAVSSGTAPSGVMTDQLAAARKNRSQSLRKCPARAAPAMTSPPFHCSPPEGQGALPPTYCTRRVLGEPSTVQGASVPRGTPRGETSIAPPPAASSMAPAVASDP